MTGLVGFVAWLSGRSSCIPQVKQRRQRYDQPIPPFLCMTPQIILRLPRPGVTPNGHSSVLYETNKAPTNEKRPSANVDAKHDGRRGCLWLNHHTHTHPCRR